MANRILQILLSLCCLTLDVQSQPNPNVCTPHGPQGEGPPLPTLPEQFLLRVEANILGWNQTIEVVEYYDSINNRGSVHNIFNGDTSQTVMDYETREIITVRTGAGCSVRNLTANSFNVFGFKLQNGTAHIGSVADIFRFGASYNETYNGTTYVRGILADHWKSCLYNEQTNDTTLLEYFFTEPGYKNAYGDSQIPLRLVINGTASNRKFINGHIVPVNGTHSFSHVYEFFDVQFHPKFADRTFEPPLGVVCPGRKSLKPLRTVPDQFSISLEVVFPATKSVFYVSEVYNYKSKVVAFYYSMPKNGSSMPTSYRSLDDFNTGLTYRINQETGFCNITPISLYDPSAQSPDHVHVQMRSFASFIDLGTQDWQYQGITEVRGMEAESWIVVRTDWNQTWMPSNSSYQTNSTWQFFFTTDAWNTQGGLNKTSNMPMMAIVDWTMKSITGDLVNGSLNLNYFHFDSASVDPGHFDLSPCFNSDNSKEFAFDILELGVYNLVITNNSIAFYFGVTHSLATAAGISPSRITNVFAAMDNDKVTTVFFDLLGVPSVKGDALHMVKQPSLTDAAVALEMLINTYKEDKEPFQIKFNLNGKEKHLTVKPDTLRNTFKVEPTKDASKQFSIGSFVGFGIGMLILGAILGVGILIYLHKRHNLNVPYNVQS